MPLSVDQRFETMQAQLEMLMQKFDTQQNELSALQLLSQENESLREENAQLLARFESFTSGATLSASVLPAGFSDAGSDPHDHRQQSFVSDVQKSSTSAPPKKKKGNRHVNMGCCHKVVIACKYETAARTFTVNDTPSEFGYLYIPHSHRLNQKDVLARIRILGVDPYRVLDIVFPVRPVVGLLLHSKYRDQVVEVLAKVNIKPLESFDPLDSSLLADPKINCKPFDEQQVFVIQLHRTRCCTALERLNYSIAVAVSRSFLEHVFVDEFDIKYSLRLCSDAPTQVCDRSSTEGDQEMTDSQSDYSDVL